MHLSPKIYPLLVKPDLGKKTMVYLILLMA
jgi:hypothetical protein